MKRNQHNSALNQLNQNARMLLALFCAAAGMAFHVRAQEFDFTADVYVPRDTEVELGIVAQSEIGLMRVKPDGSKATEITGWVADAAGTSWEGGNGQWSVELYFTFIHIDPGLDLPGEHNPLFQGHFRKPGGGHGPAPLPLWQVQANMKIASAIIKRKVDGEAGFKEINKVNKNEDVLPGELITLRLEPVDPNANLTNIKWTIGGKHFKDYVPDKKIIFQGKQLERGELESLLPSDLAKHEISFYWTDNSGGAISCKFTDGQGNVELAQETMNVHMPKSALSATLGQLYKQGNLITLANSSTNFKHGIDFTAEVNVPKGFECVPVR